MGPQQLCLNNGHGNGDDGNNDDGMMMVMMMATMTGIARVIVINIYSTMVKRFATEQ